MKKHFRNGVWFLLLFPILTFAQQTPEPLINSTLTGTIIDSRAKTPLDGATVHIKGTTHEVLTDSKGKFSFRTGQKLPFTLLINYVGYQPLEIIVNDPVVTITLQESQTQLNEVVVVGYGTQRKSDISGSVASVPKNVLSQPTASFDNLLQGAVSGVSVTQSSGQPGSTATIRVRGGNSISFGNDPLYVIDGFIVYNNNSYTNSGATSGATVNALSTINPSDIESIEVLKDASATAIYGSRGANGVVLITTKRGKKGRDEISYSGYYGVQQATNKKKLLNASQWASLVNDINISDNVPKTYTDSAIAALGEGYDWQSAGLRDGAIQNHELSFSGGDDKTRYLVSGNYFNQEGIVLNTGFKRYSGRVNYERNLSDRFKISVNIFGSSSTQDETSNANGPAFATLLQTVPLVPIKNADGSYNTNNPYISVPTNPLQDITATTNRSYITRTLGNFSAEYKILQDLKLKISAGADLINTKQNYYAPSYTTAGYTPQGYGSVGNIKATTWLNENTLTYDHIFGNDHFLNVIVGYTTQSGNDESSVASAQKFPNDLTTYNSLGSASTPLLASSNAHSWTLNSWLARASYSYKHKYNATISARADGSSVLGTNNKWGYFPSIGLSWNISEEDFLKSNNTISNLKLRLSAGQTGNSGVPPYSSLSTLAPVNYYFGNPLTLVTGIAPTQLANPDLKWETTTQYNAGIDLSIIRNRVNFSVDAYYKKTTDLLLNVPFPVYTGYVNIVKNVGSVENKGFEFSINSENIKTQNFVWRSTLVFAKNLNKVLSLGPGILNFFPTAPIGQQSPVIVQTGLPVGTFWGYTTDGLLTGEDIAKGTPLLTGVPQQEGDRKYVPINGHTSVTNADKHELGNAQPKFTFGFSNNISWKKFDLSFLLQGSYGNKIFNQYQQLLEKPTLSLNASATLLDRWSASNPNGTVPRATNSPVPQIIDRYVEDGSYLRLKNISLGYSLPQSVLSRIRIKQVRVYVSAQNLFTITSYTGFDPEVNFYDGDNTKQGIDMGLYPSVKNFTAGLNVTF
ncbi:TonB-dependent receptor [Danxiaibacter flavus]|uniref:TonB-dependent receptor n=1 Tax=Danxiaibacter flavus TaxID=3049108 RepID=A0ABV3ZFD6_9BACT|nr:TonB-dependent receptor [Chitinophagaceae bacterium DXS]